MLLVYSGQKHNEYYQCCSAPFPDITFTIRIKRIAIFYSFILILPCVLLSLLTLVSFWLPPETPAKILLGGLLLLGSRDRGDGDSGWLFGWRVYVVDFVLCCLLFVLCSWRSVIMTSMVMAWFRFHPWIRLSL